MRAFIALSIPTTIKSQITKWAKDNLSSDAGLRLTKVEQMHITLKFCANLDNQMLLRVKAVLNEVALTSKSFKLNLSNVGAFPSTKRPSVLWVGVGNGGQEVSRLSKKIHETLSELASEQDLKKQYVPHLTIARVKKNHPLLFDISSNIKFKTHAFECSKINLFKSTLDNNGAKHVLIEEFSLGKM